MENSSNHGSRTVAECQREVDDAQAAYDAVKRRRNLAKGQLPDFKVSAKSRLEAAKLALKNAEKPRHDPEPGNHMPAEPTAVMKTVMGAISSFCDVPNSTLKVKKEIIASLLPEGVVDQITIDVDADESVGDEDAPQTTNTDPELMEIDRAGENNAGIQHALSMEEKRVEKIALDAVGNSDGAQKTPMQISADTQETPVSANLAPSPQAADQTGIWAQDAPLLSLSSVPTAHFHDMDVDKLEAETMEVDRPKPAYHAEIDLMTVDRTTVDGLAESNIEVDRPSVLVPQVKDLGTQRADAPATTPVDIASDEMIKKLVERDLNSVPNRTFEIPTTVPEFLDYKFTFKPVEWDDVSTPIILRLVQESEDDFKMRREMHVREYEYTEAKRQQDELNSVYEALEALFDIGKVPPRDGRRQLAILEDDRRDLIPIVLDLQRRYEVTKAEYDRFMARQDGEEKANKLRNRLSELKEALFLVDDTDVVKTRAEYRSVQASLEEIVHKIGPTDGNGGKAKGGRKKKLTTVKPSDSEPADPGLTLEEEAEEEVKRDNELPYLKADEDGREKFKAEGRRAIQKYLNATTEVARQRALNVSLRVGLRRIAREVQEYLPELSYTTKEIALQVHIASSKNCVCRYHTYFRADSHTEWDRVDRLTGIGYPKRMCSEENGVFAPKPGHMHCGCGIDEVLLEFFFWKNLTAFSSNPQLSSISHAMGDREFIPPRLRAFWVHHFKSTTGITINDLYRRDAAEDGFITRLTAKSLIFQMNALNARGLRLALAFQSEDDEKYFNKVVE